MNLKLSDTQIERANLIKIGDRLKPNPHWNETTSSLKMNDLVEILDIEKNSSSQSGITFYVKTGRCYSWLDAAWFIFD